MPDFEYGLLLVSQADQTMEPPMPPSNDTRVWRHGLLLASEAYTPSVDPVIPPVSFLRSAPAVQVIVPPEPFVTPAQIAGSHAADDPMITAMIAAATEEIDGYTGWLGRCLAPQLLEWSLDRWPCHGWSLPIGPELEIESVDYVDPMGVPQSWPFPQPLYFENLPAVRGRAGDLRVRYWAGYGKRNAQDPSKWDEQVPARVKQAVIMSVQHMKAISVESLFLRSEEVEGIGTRSYTVSEQAGAIIQNTAKRLLSGLRVPRI